ncbi:hypothetical protein [Cupriavidus sp. PET2-C1]
MTHKEAIRSKYFSQSGEGFVDIDDCTEQKVVELYAEGSLLCEKYLPEGSELYFIDSRRVQSGAEPEYSVVLVYRGMLNTIFKIASMAATTAKVPTPSSHERNVPWRDDEAKWLWSDGFNWDDQSYWWLQDAQYRMCFDFHVDNLFRFVVLHEIGHLHNVHGIRKLASKEKEGLLPPNSAARNPSTDDSENDTQGTANTKVAPPSNEAVSAHAREIVADTYAFQFLVQELSSRLDDTHIPGDQPFLALSEHVRVAGATMALATINLYFWAMAIAIPSKPMSEEDSYPSHAFRLQSIESTWLEHGYRMVPQSRVAPVLSSSIQHSNDAITTFSSTQGYFPWRLQVSDSVYAEHYRKVCEEVPEWSNEEYGKIG